MRKQYTTFSSCQKDFFKKMDFFEIKNIIFEI